MLLDIRLWHACYLFSIKALYVMSLRHPTVARPLFTFDISPLCDVASDVRLWHALSFIFHYKPFMWCRPDARLRHYYSCSFLSRNLSDTRLAPVLLFCSFRSRRHSDPRLAPSIYLCLIALVNLFMCFMFAFVIPYVRTVLRVLS